MTTAASTLAHGVVAAAVLVLAACSSRVELIGAVPEQEANEALGALLTAGVAADKVAGKEGMVALHVQSGQVVQAVEVLKAQGLPRERFAGMGDVFRKEGLISSPLEERARYVFALSQELSATISRMDGVIAARVHVVLAERSPGGEETTPASAAVFIKHQPQAHIEALQPQVRRLVAGSIPGLASERVSLVTLPAQAPAGGAAAPQAEGAARGWRLVAALLGLCAVAASAALGWLVWRRLPSPQPP